MKLFSFPMAAHTVPFSIEFQKIKHEWNPLIKWNFTLCKNVEGLYLDP